jgi:hypothetical protein
MDCSTSSREKRTKRLVPAVGSAEMDITGECSGSGMAEGFLQGGDDQAISSLQK